MIRAHVIAGALAVLTAPAAAQPQDTQHSCEVRFVRAPDDVRHVIETWLAAEPRCTSSIDLRVIPTDQGFYLIAQRPDGRLHERFVPDAQSAGVLVASWVADDWVAPQRAREPVLAPPLYTTPSGIPGVVATIPAPKRRGHSPRWLAVGATLSTEDSADGGLRAELDVTSRGNFTLGAALAWTETSMTYYSASDWGTMRSSDYAATIYGGYTLRNHRWELRGALGFGGVYSEVNGSAEPSPGQPWPDTPYFHASGAGIIGTASLTLTARIGERWGIHGGLLAHAIVEQFPTDMGTVNELARSDSHMFFFTGLRRRM